MTNTNLTEAQLKLLGKPFNIIVSFKNNAVEYLAHDQNSGGYPYWSSRLENTHVYKPDADPKYDIEFAAKEKDRQSFYLEAGLIPLKAKELSLTLVEQIDKERAALDAEIKALVKRRNELV